MSADALPFEPVRIGLVSISDRASAGSYQDAGLPALREWLGLALKNPVEYVERLIPDERPTIEATLAIATKELPGFGEQMRQVSLKFVPTAILSRQVAVIRETPDHAALIVNLPGQPKSIRETLAGLREADGTVTVDGVFAAMPYCIDLIGGPYLETDPAVSKAFRPKSAIRAR